MTATAPLKVALAYDHLGPDAARPSTGAATSPAAVLALARAQVALAEQRRRGARSGTSTLISTLTSHLFSSAVGSKGIRLHEPSPRFLREWGARCLPCSSGTPTPTTSEHRGPS
jgi:hypothetical protein